MSNRHRGDISVMLHGKRYGLRLTLQALAEIEAAFGASDLSAMGPALRVESFRRVIWWCWLARQSAAAGIRWRIARSQA